MKLHTLLITGASGFLGWNLARAFHARGLEIAGTWNRRKPDHGASRLCLQFDLEIDDPETLLAAAAPDAVLHCAAWSSRTACEADPAGARRVNVEATRRLAESCAERGVPLLYTSTDLVFDGSAAPYTEDDPVSPASVYAETKAAAEEIVRETCAKHHILRIALMYGADARKYPGSFLAWNAGAPLRGRTVHLYTNQYRMPLYAPDVAEAVARLLERRAPWGTWHVAGPERLSRHAIGLAIARHFGIPEERMQATTLERKAEYGPVDDTSLSTEKITAATGMEFTPIERGLAETAQICGY